MKQQHGKQCYPKSKTLKANKQYDINSEIVKKTQHWIGNLEKFIIEIVQNWKFFK